MKMKKEKEKKKERKICITWSAEEGSALKNHITNFYFSSHVLVSGGSPRNIFNISLRLLVSVETAVNVETLVFV